MKERPILFSGVMVRAMMTANARGDSVPPQEKTNGQN